MHLRSKLPILLLLFLVAVLVTLRANDWRFPFPLVYNFETSAIAAESGKAYTVPLPRDGLNDAPAVLLEGTEVRRPPLAFASELVGWSRVYHYLNGLLTQRFPGLDRHVEWKPLGPGRQMHDDIRRDGAGHFSVWHSNLYFSASDGSDPRVNNRLYRLHVYSSVPPYARTALATACLLLALLLAVRGYRALGARMPALRYYAPGALIALIMLVAFFAAAEIYLRARAPFVDVAWPSYVHPVAGFLMRPREEVRHTNQTEFWVREKTNSLGFLDREPVIPKPPGTYRILVLGDSFVEAAQIPMARKFHVLLEQKLKSASAAKAVDVVAMGFSGTGQSAQLSFYEAFGRSLQPDLVILLVIRNDFANNSPILESIRNGWHPYHPPRLFFEVDGDGFRRVDIDEQWEKHLIHRPGLDPVANTSTNIQVLRRDPAFTRQLDGWRYPPDLDADQMFCADSPPLVFQQATRITGHVFGRFAELARKDRFRILVVAAENLTTLCKGLETTRPVRPDAVIAKAKELAKGAGLELLDLHPAFASKPDPSAAMFRHDTHWNEIGHEWAAAAVADHLKQRPLLLSVQ
jgi:hypothetical protein